MWTKDESSWFVVEKAWNVIFQGFPLLKVCQKLKEAKKEFRIWNREWFGNIHQNIKKCWENLRCIQGEDPTQENLSKEASINMELQERLQREETLWRQKSRIKWLSVADLNTKFFHPTTIIRRRKNAIDFIKNQQGS